METILQQVLDVIIADPHSHNEIFEKRNQKPAEDGNEITGVSVITINPAIDLLNLTDGQELTLNIEYMPFNDDSLRSAFLPMIPRFISYK